MIKSDMHIKIANSSRTTGPRFIKPMIPGVLAGLPWNIYSRPNFIPILKRNRKMSKNILKH
jgi:hypothetical protein